MSNEHNTVFIKPIARKITEQIYVNRIVKILHKQGMKALIHDCM